MQSVKPTILFGLDQYGLEIIDNFYSIFNSEEANILKNVIRVCTVNPEGDCVLPEKVIELPELNSDYTTFDESFYTKIFQVFEDRRDEYIYNIENLLREIQSLEAQNVLTKNNIDKGASQIIIVGTTFNPIGSIFSIQMLDFLNSINENFSITLILFLPELSKSKDINIRKIERARTYSFLSELDQAVPKSLKISGIFLLNNENEKENTLTQFSDIVPITQDFLRLLVHDKVFTRADMLDIIGL
ncbi:MAG: hypothetical protein K8S18_06435, partial [Desulfobacula sp.]|nr:hypothetical protein [Desulfobacula sp.]